ncbi:MAG TPA: hypothetical protein VFQ39_04060 [Longimicrobium sp.]|nr:hypothetical protein [Longimicrobium sp.]
MKSVKTAFRYRWNLLAFFGGVAASFATRQPDVFLPFVAAGELAYLWGMVSFPKFRKAVAREGYQSPNFPTEPVAAKDPGAAIRALVQQLPRDAQARFEALRARCLEMRDIARGVRGRAGDPQAETIGAPALDRLLWSFLRLLVSQTALNRFLATTNGAQLEQRAQELKARLEKAQTPAAGQTPDERLLRSLTDSVAVADLRLENYRKAQANAEFVQIELDRIEAKINALTEMAVNRQDPDFLSSQVDAAADSMAQTESTMAELQSITGLVDDLEEPPPILESDLKSYDVA